MIQPAGAPLGNDARDIMATIILVTGKAANSASSVLLLLWQYILGQSCLDQVSVGSFNSGFLHYSKLKKFLHIELS